MTDYLVHNSPFPIKPLYHRPHPVSGESSIYYRGEHINLRLLVLDEQ